MCGRIVTPEQAALERFFHIGRHNSRRQFVRRFNVAPSMEIPVLRLAPGVEGYELAPARWTLVPGWWKEARPPRFTHNTRIEEAAAKPMWRQALRAGRCLIPVEGWYEWQELQRPDPATGELKPAKQPHFIHRPDGSLACLAGLTSLWSLPGSEPVLTCSVLTTEAAPAVAGVHERMPVVLSFEAYQDWLDPELQDGARALAVARQGLETKFSHYLVSLRLNGKADDEALCRPLEA